ncbi:uncharacterized protein LOC110665126 [Hevea brasiliensis]|uniref:uncharacterized protein LOC110665126 n=1 Tax=Hevea brasiliensis TaxID=3981 RepID=UPI000B77BB7E|nr:uncharacterized protein LOC110665126 [Hevea brasiliensis]XP_057985693.1 uncharacterized protein LOC110665126 [Hevea brasiliensis]
MDSQPQRSLRLAYRKIFMSVDANSVSFEVCLAELKINVEYAGLDIGMALEDILLSKMRKGMSALWNWVFFQLHGMISQSSQT